VTIKPNTSYPIAGAPRSHFYVLLDRSGSMASMRADVIGGFNQLLADQQADGPDARLTLVQFDSQDPHEVVSDALAITRVRPLTEATFVPRGGTPLLDATGRLIARAAARAGERHARGKRPEDVTVVTITDGMENQSHEHSRADILRLVKDMEARGWSFVFLGAGLDAYADSTAMGYDPRSVQAWAPDGTGARRAFASLSAAMVDKRGRARRHETYDRQDYFDGAKPAEADRKRRHGP
jgi:hypothetical protein